MCAIKCFVSWVMYFLQTTNKEAFCLFLKYFFLKLNSSCCFSSAGHLQNSHIPTASPGPAQTCRSIALGLSRSPATPGTKIGLVRKTAFISTFNHFCGIKCCQPWYFFTIQCWFISKTKRPIQFLCAYAFFLSILL